MPITQKRYGWHPSLPDQRDLRLSLGAEPAPPPAVNLRHLNGPVRNQGNLGSCTGFGATNAYRATSAANGKYPNPMSALFAYYNARWYEGTTGYDSGATVRDVVKGIAKFGVPLESSYPYQVSKFARKPSDAVYAAAERHQALRYYSVAQNELAIRRALATGYPIIIGFSVYESFESDVVERTGLVPMPEPGEAVLGGHCVLLDGYDMADMHPWDCLNQWGKDWGAGGYFKFPREYLTNPQLAGDFWTLRLTEG